MSSLREIIDGRQISASFGHVYQSLMARADVGDTELRAKLQDALRDKFGIPSNGPYAGPWPWIEDIFPLQSYFVYTSDGDKYKMTYKLQDDGEIKLTGDAKKVKIAYVEAGGRNKYHPVDCDCAACKEQEMKAKK